MMLAHTYFNFLSFLYQKLCRVKVVKFKQGKILDLNHLDIERSIMCQMKITVETIINVIISNIKDKHHK